MLGLDMINGLSPAKIAILVTFFAILLVVILFMSYYRTLSLIWGFAYPNAVIKAIGTPYVYRENLEKLAESSTHSDVVASLVSMRYEVKGANYEELMRAVNREQLAMIQYALRVMPEGMRSFKDAYIRFLEYQILKKAILIKFSGNDYGFRYLAPVGAVDDTMLREIAEAASLEDALATIKQKFPDTEKIAAESPVKLAIIMDMASLSALKASLSHISAEMAAPLREFVGTLIDVINIKTVVRCISQGIAAKDYLVPGGRHLSAWLLEQLADSKDIGTVLRDLEATPYSVIKEQGVENIEKALDTFLLNEVRRLSSIYALGAGPLVYFLVAKEFEARNIKAVLLGLEHGKKLKDYEDKMVMVA